MIAIEDMHDAFVADIIANPADNTPRLIYADWLEDNDEELRAEFIRVQIQVDGMPCILPATSDLEWLAQRRETCRHCQLTARASHILGLHEWPALSTTNKEAWAGKETLERCSSVGFSRGFVGGVSLTTYVSFDKFFKNLKWLMATHPIDWVGAADLAPAGIVSGIETPGIEIWRRGEVYNRSRTELYDLPPIVFDKLTRGRIVTGGFDNRLTYRCYNKPLEARIDLSATFLRMARGYTG